MSKQRVIGNYSVLREIGSGSYGHVYLAQHNATGEHVAIKTISKSRLRADQLERYLLATSGQIPFILC
jgi:serine/threonine protein kinase